MISVTEYKGQRVGVFGLGKAGESTIAALLAGGAEVYAWDDGESGRASVAAKYPAVKLAPFADWPWSTLKALILSPGVPLTHPVPHPVVALVHQNNCPVIGDIELLYRACPEAKYIAITGTNGKSTTTTLIGHILKNCGVTCEIGGNLGTPALSLAPLGKGGVYVLELSSYQLDLVKTTRFNVAAWLNITPDHIDRHGDIEGYIAAKKHIFERQQDGDVAVVAIDDTYSYKVASGLGNAVTISAQSQADVFVKDGVLHDGGKRFDLNTIATLPGRHNWQNAAIAYGCARAIGLAPEAIYKAMQSFAGLRHRLQLVATVNGVRFINDSKATNADATANALTPYENIYWIAGGKQKEGGIVPLAEYFPKIAHAFLIGAAEEEFARTLEGKVPYTRCGTLKTAVEKAAQMAFAQGKKDAVVLLSPACASFDQWKNFEERGDAFCAQVEILAKEKAA